MSEFDQVIGYEGEKNEFYRILDILKNPAKYKELGISMPNGILLDGDPGLGKSLMAKCFVKESGRTAFTIRKDRPDGEFVDHIRETFEKAVEAAPSIVFLDDMDKFSDEDGFRRNAEEYVTVQACFDEIKGKDVFVIATSNDQDKLPESLLRAGRFDKIFEIKYPEAEDAKKILAHYLTDKHVEEDIDIEELSCFCSGRSCAEMELAVNDAGIQAGFENRKVITKHDLIQACLKIFFHSTSLQKECNQEGLYQVAVHEAGHACLAEILNPGSVNFITIKSDKVGLTSRKPADVEQYKDKQNNILIALAGKAATEIIFDRVDTGCNNDMHKAFDETRWMLDGLTSRDFYSWCHGQETSQKVYDHLDEVTASEVTRYYQETKRILAENREFVEAIAQALMEQRTISYKEIAAIRGKYCIIGADVKAS